MRNSAFYRRDRKYEKSRAELGAAPPVRPRLPSSSGEQIKGFASLNNPTVIFQCFGSCNSFATGFEGLPLLLPSGAALQRFYSSFLFHAQFPGMGRLQKILIPFLGLVLAFCFYSARENFKPGKY